MNLSYDNYYGHTLEDLNKIFQSSNNPKIYLAGDSILDNKFWVKNEGKVNKVKNLFDIPDIEYHMNDLIEDYTCINCASEESKVENKIYNYQDKFIHDNITKDDILVISIGGNDFLLNPDNLTRLGKAQFSRILKGKYEDENYLQILNIFNLHIPKYIKYLIGKNTPKKIIYLFPYFPCEVKGQCWSSAINLIMIFKGFLKDTMRNLYKDMKLKENIIKLPLFKLFNPEKEEDYIQRLEPSILGGRKIASLILKNI